MGENILGLEAVEVLLPPQSKFARGVELGEC